MLGLESCKVELHNLYNHLKSTSSLVNFISKQAFNCNGLLPWWRFLCGLHVEKEKVRLNYFSKFLNIGYEDWTWSYGVVKLGIQAHIVCLPGHTHILIHRLEKCWGGFSLENTLLESYLKRSKFSQ